MTKSPRVALFPLGAGLVAVFEDGGVEATNGTGVATKPGQPVGDVLSCYEAVKARKAKVVDACALGGGIAVLGDDDVVDTRNAAHPGRWGA